MLSATETGTLAEDEAGILAHMNTDHTDAIDLYARSVLPGARPGWQLTAIDPEGIDMLQEEVRCRLDFGSRVTDSAQARQELVRLVKDNRAREGPERKS